jgi:hypothetical protein
MSIEGLSPTNDWLLLGSIAVHRTRLSGPIRFRFGTVVGDALYEPDLDCNSDGEIGICGFGCLREYYGAPIPPNRRGCTVQYSHEDSVPL